MKRRLVLVYPQYVSGWLAQPRMATPLSILCVGTPVSRAGYEVRIIDQRIEPRWRSMLLDELSCDPICVGVSAMTGPQLRHALEVSRIVKEHGSAPVVWGGVHPSLLPEQTVRDENIDIVVQGEGEQTFLELVQALEGKEPLSSVKGIWYKDGAEVRSTGPRPFVDLNQLPPIAYDLVDLGRYRRILFGVPHHNFFTSRGCPRQCTFCYNTAFNGRKWRAMEPDLAVGRIKDFVTRYGIRGLILNESNFFLDVERGRAILRGIIAEGLDLVISKVNIDYGNFFDMTPEDFVLLQRAGCRRLPVAIESGSEKIRALIKKSIDNDRLLEMNRLLQKTQIVPNYLFMMGFPTETRADLMESISLAFRLVEDNDKAGIYFNVFTPYPGTELFDVVVKHGLIPPRRIEDWIAFNYRNVVQDGPWLSARMRKSIQMMDFCSFFIGNRPFLKPTEQTHRVASLLGNLYAPIARRRARHLWYHFPVEIGLAKFLRIYGKQG